MTGKFCFDDIEGEEEKQLHLMEGQKRQAGDGETACGMEMSKKTKISLLSQQLGGKGAKMPMVAHQQA